jgi:hypothetical protein
LDGEPGERYDVDIDEPIDLDTIEFEPIELPDDPLTGEPSEEGSPGGGADPPG